MKHLRCTIAVISAVLLLSASPPPPWGFWAHKRINRLAVFRLPPEMAVFFKKNIDFITENAVNPDRRRYAVVGEAERHYIDLDVYGDSAAAILPRYWKDAVAKFGEDSLRKHGIAPWHIQFQVAQLTEAFRQRHAGRILRLATDLGHYVADAHVPLHTTRNYNGQLTGQEGIHGFWESRLPELFAEDYPLWIGKVVYVDNPAARIWEVVFTAHQACDSVLLFEKQLTKQLGADHKYTYQERNNVLVKTYSPAFSKSFHEMLDGQVERQMKAAIGLIGDLWYTCWVNAGQPDLSGLSGIAPAAETEAPQEIQRLRLLRPEPDVDP